MCILSITVERYCLPHSITTCIITQWGTTIVSWTIFLFGRQFLWKWRLHVQGFRALGSLINIACGIQIARSQDVQMFTRYFVHDDL